MLCRNCGTEIADKAIVCYKCGTATAAPVRQPARLPSSRRPTTTLSLVALVVLMALALYLGRAGSGQLSPEASYAIAGAAALVLVWRQYQRLRRR
jgi:hypothetical protein